MLAATVEYPSLAIGILLGGSIVYMMCVPWAIAVEHRRRDGARRISPGSLTEIPHLSGG